MRWHLTTIFLFAPTLCCATKGPASPEPSLKRFATGARPSHVAAGDLSGEGHVDLVTANSGSRDLTVIWGDGRGGFSPAPGSPVALDFAPHLVALADLDGDGDRDAAATGHDTHRIAVLLNQGGRLETARSWSVPAMQGGEPHNHGLVLADMNHDGRIDLVTGNQNDNSVSVLLGRPGGFAPAPGSPTPVGRAPYLPAVGDLNGDKHIDVAVANARSNNISVLLGDGTGALAAPPGSPWSISAFPNSAALVDLNGDGVLDVLATHADASALSVLIGDGRGGFRPGPPIASPNRGWKVQTADVSGDGRVDLVMGAQGGVVVVLRGDGKGGFGLAPGSPYPIGGRGPWASALTDVDADGRFEVVTANEESNDLSVLWLSP